MGCVYAYVILLTFLGPENLGRSFEVADDEDLEEAAGHSAMVAVLGEHGRGAGAAGYDRDSSDDGQHEKAMDAGIERV